MGTGHMMLAGGLGPVGGGRSNGWAGDGGVGLRGWGKAGGAQQMGGLG